PRCCCPGSSDKGKPLVAVCSSCATVSTSRGYWSASSYSGIGYRCTCKGPQECTWTTAEELLSRRVNAHIGGLWLPNVRRRPERRSRSVCDGHDLHDNRLAVGFRVGQALPGSCTGEQFAER